MDKQFWRIPDLMVHREYDLYFQAIHSLLLLRNESIRKNILSQTIYNLIFWKRQVVCSIPGKDI